MTPESGPTPASRLGRLRRSIAEHWPVWLALLFFAFLPLRRQMEFPLSIFALSLAFLAYRAGRREEIRSASRFVLPLFLCIWLPMLISSFDTLDPGKSWMHTVGAVRYLAAALAIAVLLSSDASRALHLRLVTWLLLFWAADGYFQLAFGYDVFGVPMHEDRLNALFYSRYQYYGPSLAILSPLALHHMRRNWSTAAWTAGFIFILGAVLISGMRSAWLMMGIVMVAFMFRLWRDHARRRQALLLPAAALLTVTLAVFASPLLQQRLELTSLAVVGTEEAIDEATSYRVPIFRNAWAMYLDHPINGVGVRAFGEAYRRYAGPDDPHLLPGGETRAHQAHNVVLEFMADTGTIGLLGFIAAWVVAWRYWRSLDGPGRDEAFPYAVALLAIAFPLNSYFSLFGVYTMSVTWVLIGLMAAPGLSRRPARQRQVLQEIPTRVRR